MIDPIGLNKLIPDWKARSAPVDTPVTDDRFYFLGPASRIRIPHALMPPLMSNRGNYIISLGLLCRWLAQEAEALGVEIYPGFAAVDVELGEAGQVTGIITGDMGVARDGHHKGNHTPRCAARQIHLDRRGSAGPLAKQFIARFRLAEGRAPQTLWTRAENCELLVKHRLGLVMHSMAPLTITRAAVRLAQPWRQSRLRRLCGPSRLHEPVSFIVRRIPALQDANLSLPDAEGGRRIGYGARAISEGGFQAVPKLVFRGRADRLFGRRQPAAHQGVATTPS